ncbi:glycoside hydrolase [Stereum hirsutum FP-91666 SS1]|uniref:glycoside hydrolase n=1 Tax=Stereum hirsutum (strain FP-91666) TaxID=721885 RepID=UPI00044493AF|nr:glycoside hydrolase [Stereum hirsutum FP-91666 SS1]EIM86201.1 glycoside hydrolase [Stereum hirsutum FP-91666 SS1]
MSPNFRAVSLVVATIAFSVDLARTAPQAGVDSTSVSATATVTSVSTVSVSTVVASPTASLSATLPSQVPLPPHQAWCPSEIFCAGEILQTVNLAQLYTDPKTFVDKPTLNSTQSVLTAFASINATDSNGTTTEGSVLNFVDTNFGGEGLELEALVLGSSSSNSTPAFLQNVTDPVLNAWAGVVNGYWSDLIRSTNESAVCEEGTSERCESSLIPLNHTFVIPGGRFREQYYWDSFWIVEGLLKSELYDIVNSTLQNFMDEIETLGFIPNGGRIYYLNRSQPPLFIHMLYNYVTTTNDTSILTRALPLAENELSWWRNNRTIEVRSSYTNQTYDMARYAVTNSAPRPESYLTDYETANDPTLPALNETERAELYSELASGAETGWDYSTRFVSQPLAGGSNNTIPALRSLNVKNTIPVDLNSLLYNANALLASLYTISDPSSSNETATTLATQHLEIAETIKAGILDLFWDAEKLAFYDYNLTSDARNDIFSMATFYPFWVGIVPDEILTNETNAFGAFASVNMVMQRYNGTLPVTFIESGLQWDDNAWPPHQYIAIQALLSLPSNLTTSPLPTPPTNASSYALIPSGQLSIAEDELPGQPIAPLSSGVNATKVGPGADINLLGGGNGSTVLNGGSAAGGEGWRDMLVREVANRYVGSAFCSWYSTGGSLPGLLPRLSDAALNISGSINNTGNMFEKFSRSDIDIGGTGGEYTVQAGFGWTNGVVLWAASNFGHVLTAPTCPDPLVELTGVSSNSSSTTTSTGSATATATVTGSLSGFVSASPV